MSTVNFPEVYQEARLSAQLASLWSSMQKDWPVWPRSPLHIPPGGDTQFGNLGSTFLTETKAKGESSTAPLVGEAALHKPPCGSGGGDRSGAHVTGKDPVQYFVPGLRPHELPVQGTYVDPAIIPGFCYKVRQVDSSSQLFKGRPLQLESVGRGYGKRITFVGDSHNNNDNYFWSDTHPAGYGFNLCLVREGDKFTVSDANNFPVATAEVVKILEPQVEVGHKVVNGAVEKKAHVSLFCRVSYFDPAVKTQVLPVRGVALAVKPGGSRTPAALKEVVECSVGGERGWRLVAGLDSNSRVKVVTGSNIGDVPIKYTIRGLLAHELPVVGTYVDPAITTGFKYRVRPVDSRRPLFGGDALVLQSVGRGYGKRITFASDNLNDNQNYFWSDSNPEGFGFSIQAVSPGDNFRIKSSCGEEVGRVQVFRADLPQVEESSTVSHEGHVTKRVQVTLTCDLSFHDGDDHTLVVTGIAVVVRRGRRAAVTHLEQVALGSHINQLFSHASKSLVFIRE